MDILVLDKKYKENDAQRKVEELQSVLSNEERGSYDISLVTTDLSYYSDLSNKISRIRKAIDDWYDAKNMVENESELDIKEMAMEEVTNLENEIEELDKEITKLRVSREFEDEDDSKPAIIEIRAGAGGEEASLFAADLFGMYKGYATNKGWNFQVMEASISETGGYKEVIAHIEGKNVFKELKYESGVHRVQRVPSTESSGRIHTSTASVAILPEAREVDVQINPEDIRIDVMRASGAGGQCVNKTDSAVRITHIQTGIVVSCQETKHQLQNKEKAMTMLRARLYDRRQEEAAAKRGDLRSKMIGSAMRAEKIRTYNFPQNRVTDHRIKKSWFNIEGILEGDLGELIQDVRDGIIDQLLAESE